MAMQNIYKDKGASLVATINVSPSVRRKSLHVSNVPTLTLAENNDEAERLARRHDMTTSLSLTENLQTNNKRRSLGLGFLAQMSAPEMKDCITKCVKLSTENKINVKNAFGLQIIDLMTYMIKKQDANMTNLQVASTSLDVSTKIYGFRVDSVYTEIMKMAGGLDRQEDASVCSNMNEHGNNEEESETNGLSKEGRKKKKRNKQKIFSTIESLKGPIEIMKPSLWMMENGDTQTADALYQVMQSSNSQNSKFCLQLYNDVIVDMVNHKMDSKNIEVTIPKIGRLSDLEICPPLTNFEFQGWSSDNEKEENNACSEKGNENEFQFDLDASLPTEDELDHNGINYWDIQNVEDNVKRQIGTQQPMEKIADLCKVVSDTGVNKTSEYFFLERSTNIHWAGPTHWRVNKFAKLLGRSKIIGACQQEAARKRREIELRYDDNISETRLAKFAISKSIKLEATNIDWYEESVTLPRDMHYSIANASKLYHHKLINIKNKKEDLLNITHVSDVYDYDYNNDNDTSNYCPNVPTEDYGRNEENTENCGAEGAGIGEQTIFTGDNLVAVPTLTSKISIAYSTRAKRVDMKQLKKSIWKSLTTNPNDENTNMENKANQETEMKENKCFSEIYKTLPTMLSKTNIEALSFPISFVSLLHLANEKTLSLQSLPDMSDLIVKAD